MSHPPPLQLKTLTPHNVMQLVNQQGILKVTIPVVNISQGASGQIGTPVNVTSLLKPADKISAGFAQLVQTSTGKHLLLRANPSITANIPVTTTQGGQKLTFLSQPVSTIGNAGHAVTQAFVKFQLTSVTTIATTSTVTTTNSNTIAVVKNEDKAKNSRTTIGNDYIGKLYSKQNSLDVRWSSEEKVVGIPDEEDPKGERRRRLTLMTSINKRRCSALPLYGRDFQEAVKIFSPNKVDHWDGGSVHCLNTLYNTDVEEVTSCLKDMLYNPERRIEQLKDMCDRFIFYVPAVKCQEPELQVWHPPPSVYRKQKEDELLIQKLFSKPATPLHHIASAMVTQFPDPRLIQYDCGKLQTLDMLLRRLKPEGHRVLIFTQMTKMLDVLEAFLNFHGHIYLRLDGTTKVDQRQVLMERFNGDKRIFAFILSTRSGGVGVNLTGADTVIFYDSDWNPTMDAQAQDRCHRIGQTRDVHIYRLVSERTIEENILKKANQKRLLGDLAIEGGNFTTAYFKSTTIQDLFNVDQNEESAVNRMSEVIEMKKDREKSLSNEASVLGDEKVAMGALENALAACEDDQDVQAAKTAKAEAVADLAEFDENIPLEEQEKEKEPEISKAEQEINSVMEKLSAIERYAMRFIETTESAWSAEQLAAAEREIEEQKREWEQNRLAAMREEEERRARELEEESDMITFSRADATNQVSSKNKVLSRHKKFIKHTKNRRANRIVKRSSSSSVSVRKIRRKVKIAVKVNLDSNEPQCQSDVDNSQESPQPDDSRVDADTDNSMHSIQSDDFNSTALKVSNHVDHNSPRTRSRGTVAINLWTLDVSPILPGEKPSRKHRKSASIDSDEDDSMDERNKSKTRNSSDCEINDTLSDCESNKRFKRMKKDIRRRRNNSSMEGSDNESRKKISNEERFNLFSKGKICKVVLNDIVAQGHYKIPKEIREEMEISIRLGKDSPTNEESDPWNNTESKVSGKDTRERELSGKDDTKQIVSDVDVTEEERDSEGNIIVEEIAEKHCSAQEVSEVISCEVDDETITNDEASNVFSVRVERAATDIGGNDPRRDSADLNLNDSANVEENSKRGEVDDESVDLGKKNDSEADGVGNNASLKRHSDDLSEADSPPTDSKVLLETSDAVELVKETPKENIEINNKLDRKSSHTDNGLNDFKKIPSLMNNRKDNFRFNESRKTYKKFYRFTNNRTLDNWVKRSPVSPGSNSSDKSTNESKAGFSNTSSGSLKDPK
ncbi:hypothetical protein JTB14_028601 [Gonioctena quinquepunctata]|nr:hypothetical protein JTB14_028601 [Gonioctena quinquepunctata]